MNYKLKDNSLNDLGNIKKTILLNRGIENWEDYLSLSQDNLSDYNDLDNIELAVSTYCKHIDNKSHIHVVVDCDVDGYTSGSVIVKDIKSRGNAIVTYSLHTKKKHGLSEDIEIPIDCDLLIIPDAGSNDVEECRLLNEKGIDIIILDHHICDKNNPYAIVVNNQLSKNYNNKELCGVGVVYQFLRAVDDERWEDYSNSYLDLVALGNISDNMDMRSFETRYLVNLGLNKIHNKLFKALIDKQSYSMGDDINITSIQFYITPLINAMIRVGRQDEKELMFKAFLEVDEDFEYTYRGVTKDKTIYERVARLCANTKNRQAKETEKGVQSIKELIEKRSIDKDKIMFINATDILNETLTGLVAIKIAERYNKPCVVLKKRAINVSNDNKKVSLKVGKKDFYFETEVKKDTEINSEPKVIYGGSCRNFNNSPIDSLKDFLTSLNTFDFVQGHDNASGVSIERDNIVKSVELCNKELSNVDFEKCYIVDFEIDAEDLSVSIIHSIDSMKELFCNGVDAPLVCINNVNITTLALMGANKDSWKYVDDCEGIAYVKFKVGENDRVRNMAMDEVDSLDECDFDDFDYTSIPINTTINLIGKLTVNNYKGILTPQVIVEDYEVIG